MPLLLKYKYPRAQILPICTQHTTYSGNVKGQEHLQIIFTEIVYLCRLMHYKHIYI